MGEKLYFEMKQKQAEGLESKKKWNKLSKGNTFVDKYGASFMILSKPSKEFFEGSYMMDTTDFEFWDKIEEYPVYVIMAYSIEIMVQG